MGSLAGQEIDHILFYYVLASPSRRNIPGPIMPWSILFCESEFSIAALGQPPLPAFGGGDPLARELLLQILHMKRSQCSKIKDVQIILTTFMCALIKATFYVGQRGKMRTCGCRGRVAVLPPAARRWNYSRIIWESAWIGFLFWSK